MAQWDFPSPAKPAVSQAVLNAAKGRPSTGSDSDSTSTFAAELARQNAPDKKCPKCQIQVVKIGTLCPACGIKVT